MIFLTCQGVRVENNHPTTNRTPPQTHKTAPRIDEQGKGKVFIPPDDSRPLERQIRPVQG
ncbi:gp47 [Propionibacterium phage PA6]|uniref:Gp47 n=1 Tax=Propionibacterium phage PA6 TaxID=376758 RepID=A4K4B4_9CAUD|nr:gp47 [Propionibacterium phage PA6]ABE68616.1 gp47 [Propionibacterium phage PA6]